MPSDYWTRILARCRASGIPQPTMALWLEPGDPLRIEDERLVVAFPADLYAWVSRRYARLLGETARAEGLGGIRLVTA